MKIVGLIPARGGSKRIPRKNLANFGGRRLIEWTISAARFVKELDELWVCTDSHRIGHVAAFEGCNVLWRPAELSADDTPTQSVADFFDEEVEADRVVLLQPTSPLRSPEAIQKAATTSGSHCVSVSERSRWTVEFPRHQTVLENGAVYVFPAGEPIRFVYPSLVCMPEWQSVDIDTYDDLAIAELMLERHRSEVYW